ncbi:MAG: extracellular solute-binding protein [Alkalispirochaeta sp.]|jgi:raffinose/stachyose/melibiose transport system substrate-binding protein
MKRLLCNLLVAILMVSVIGVALAAGKKDVTDKGVVIQFWHIDTAQEAQPYWQDLADEFMAQNPGVRIEITVLENEAFKSRLTAMMQAGDPPDIYRSWGGGVLVEHAKAGLAMDITKDVQGSAFGDTIPEGALGVYAYQGRQYGVPYDLGAVTFWYNTEILAEAGWDKFPATWSDLLQMVRDVRDAGYIPMALAGADKWPAHFYWTYLAMRMGGKAAIDGVLAGTGSFTDKPFVQAGELLLDLRDAGAFQTGFLGATQSDQAALVGNREAAMELMGQWAPYVQADASLDGGIGNALAVAPFPLVEGGPGAGTDVLGGGNGFEIGRDAPAEAIEFMKFMVNKKNNTALARTGRAIPTVIGAEAGIEDPLMRQVAEVVAQAQYFQLYLDQFFPPAVGGVINDAVQAILADKMSPEKAARTVQDAWLDHQN